MHGQSAGPSYTRQTEEEGWGGRDGGFGGKGAEERRNKDLWFYL